MKFSNYIIILSILATTNFLGSRLYQMLGYGKEIGFIALLLILLWFVINKKKKDSCEAIFSKEVLFLIIVPFISAISCYVYREQDIVTTIIATRNVCFWVIYFLLHRVSFGASKIRKILVYFATAATLVYIIQQIVYPTYYWFDSLGTPFVDIRSGFYRFRLFWNNPYIYFAYFFYAVYAIKKKNSTYKIITLFFFMGIFLTLTRQIWFCCLLPVFMYPLLNGKNISIKKILSICVSFTLLYFLVVNLISILGAKMVNDTLYDLKNNEDNIRMLSLNYYGLEYWENALNVIFGNGVAAFGKSDYGNHILYMENVHALYRSDIGIVGVMSQFGALYVFVLLMYYIKVLKNFKYLSTHMRMLFVASIINLPLASWDIFPLFMGCITYYADCEIMKNKRSLAI